MLIDLILVKYSQQGAQGLLKEGFRSRRAEVQKVAEAYGERLGGYSATDDGDWDVVFILEGAADDGNPAASVAANLHAQASGTIARLRRLRLYTPEAADADLGATSEMRYAGQGPVPS